MTELSTDVEFKWQSQIEHKDLINFGLIPEFVGRLPNIVTLESLTETDMISILQNSKISILKQVQKLFKFDSIDLIFDNQYCNDVARLAFEKEIGARGLRSIVESSLHNLMFRAPELRDTGVSEIVFAQYPESVDTYPTLVYNDGRKEVDKDYKITLRG